MSQPSFETGISSLILAFLLREHKVICLVLGQKKDSCVQVSEDKRIRVCRSKSIFILESFFITNVQRL